MDVIERLPLDAASAHTLIACEHRHRYEFASELCRAMRVLDLCCGTGYGSQLLARTAATVVGVDNDGAVIDAARAAVGGGPISFEAADAGSYLEAGLRERFDAILCFEGLEHLPEVDRALKSLRRLSREGVKLVISVPNSRLFNEQNPYHMTDFSYETAMAAFSDFSETVVVPQYLAEGSAICPASAEAVEFTFAPDDRLEIEYANHFIFCVGFPETAVTRAHHGRIQVEAAPAHNRYMRNLEAANAELRQANARLARTHLATTGSAAATRQFRLERELTARDQEIRAISERAERAERDRDTWKERCLAAETARGPSLDEGGEPVAGGHGYGAEAEQPRRLGGLEVHEVANGVLVYRGKSGRVLYLNNTAAIVFELCDGSSTSSEISDQLAATFGLDDPPTELVLRCIAELRSKRLVT